MENTDINEQLNVENKLMKKTKIRLISFFFIIVIDIVLLIVNQDNPLFLFVMNRSEDSIASYGSYQMISWILMLFILLFLISYVVLLVAYRRKEPLPKNDFKKIYNFFDFLTVIPVFFLIVMVINSWFFTIAVVDGPSMEPTYYTSDVVVIGYQHTISKNDVIVFQKDKLYIKRVIAGPLDSLVIRNNEVWVNGEFVEYTTGDFTYEGIIGMNQYFVLGDNRDNSRDSRVFGFVQDSELVGRVVLD